MDFDNILFMHWCMVHVVTDTHYFPELFNRVMTLDWFRIMFMLNILWKQLVDLIKSGRYMFIDIFMPKYVQQ